MASYNSLMVCLMGCLAAANEATARVLLWGGLAIAVLLAMGAALVVVRRLYQRWMTESPRRPGFSVDQLERLRRQGTISDEEFRRLRRQAMEAWAAGGEGRREKADGTEKADSTSSSPPKLDDEESSDPAA